MQHNLRRSRGDTAVRATILERCVSDHGLFIAVDPDQGIIDEWMRTDGREAVSALVVAWYEAGILYTVPKLGSVPAHTRKALRKLGFGKDMIDKLVLRVALATADRIVVSEDSDFWDPFDTTRPGKIGDRNAPVAKLLAAKLDVQVMLLSGLLTALGVPT